MKLNRRTFIAGTAASAALTAMPFSKLRAQEGGTLTIAHGYDPRSLWPNDFTAQEMLNAANAITESLCWGDPETGKVVPILLESFEQTEPTKVVMKVRPGITFTNGEPLDADAVVNSLTVFADINQAPAYGFFGKSIDTIAKVDDMTVEMTTKEPYPAMGLLLAQVYVTPPKYWAEVGVDGFRTQPIGTGPYKLVEWVRDNKLVMEPNADYWGGAPEGVTQLVWRPVPNDMARAAGLQAGEFDIATNLPIAAVGMLKGAGIEIIAVPSFRIYMLTLSMLPEEDTPLHDKRVRQALNYAVDKQAIVDALFAGEAKVLNGQLLRPAQVGYNPDLSDYPYDPEKAKALLAEAGYADGFEIQFKFPSGRYAQDREVAEAVSGMLSEVGVTTNMVALEAGEFLAQLDAKKLGPLAMLGTAPADDPDAMFAQFRSDWRYSYTQSPELDALIDAGASEIDPEKRGETYAKLSQLMFDEAFVLYLYQGADFYGTSQQVKGFAPRGDQRYLLAGIDLA
ncbi:ABC transporter substrate-binding protein [Acuticoccus sediminis]|uniref:ABC transporter substrate-binding protein n=1 Tax=Acuticoccus sediminis TaxID=2184697 RepID=UPI001CFD7A4F|nr:ABC transporter substrate-binding protein [Acuticoccus sediminis]